MYPYMRISTIYTYYSHNFVLAEQKVNITIGTVDLHFIAEVGYMLSVLMQ